MNTRKNRLFSLILIGAFAAALALALPLHQVHASGLFGDLIGGFASGVFGWAIYAVIWVASMIAGAIIIVITYFISVALFMSNNIVNTFAVQSGYTVTLAVANLGFVLAIIVIALATILRRESYGIKSVLWKLVVAAILVNFSLVIGGAIINFANTLTNAFLYQLSPTSSTSGDIAFAEQLAGAFAPQRALLSSTSTAATSNAIQSNVGGDIATVITPLIGLFASTALLIVIVITLAVFLFMLFIRYIYLAFLLILMPFAWLLWLFPQTKHHWTKWWQEFIRWSFFAPIVVFFLWLAIATAQTMSAHSASNPLAGAPTGTSNTILSAVGGSLGGFFTGAADAMLQGLIVVGLAVGGMIVANKLSITGASAGIGAMQKVGNAASGYAAKQGKKGASRMVPTKMKEKMQEGRLPIIPRRVQSWGGRGLQKVEEAGTTDLVAKEAAWAKAQAKDPKNGARMLAGSLNKEQQLALLKQMMDQNDLDQVKTVNGKELGKFLNDKKHFESAGQAKLFSDLNKRIESTPPSRKAAVAVADEMAKVEPKINTAEAGIKSLDKQLETIESAEGRARKAYARNPNAVYTDADGVVGNKGEKMKVDEFLNKVTQKYEDVSNHKQNAVALMDEIKRKAEGRATVVDEEDKLGHGAGATVNAKELLDKEMEEHIANQKKEDAGKAMVNDIFGKGARLGFDERTADILGESFAGALARKRPDFVGSFLYKMKAQPMENFRGTYEKILDAEIKQAEASQQQAGSNEQLAAHFRDIAQHFTDRKEAFSKARAFNMSYVSGPDTGSGQAQQQSGGPSGGNTTP